MNATIKDVAKAAGVSVASVSRALNGHHNVADVTRQRVVGEANRLRYMPNGAARSLITRRTQTIGAVLPDLHGEFFSELIRGMDLAARERGLHLLISSSHGSASEVGEVMRALRGRVDGLLIMSPHADAAVLADNLPAALPTVLLNTRVAGDRYTSLSIDNYGGAYAMVEHLVQSGRRRIAFVAGPADNLDADERLRGYRAALADLVPDEVELIQAGDFGEESGARAAAALASLAHPPDAIFAANDMMAFGCLFELAERGVPVPAAMAVVGFDDIPIARYVHPRLTTVRVRIADLGRAALDRLALQIENPEMNTRSEPALGCEIVVRLSCGGSKAG